MLLYSSVCFCIPPPQKAHTHAVLLNRAHYALHVSILYPHTRPFGLVRESFNSVFLLHRSSASWKRCILGVLCYGVKDATGEGNGKVYTWYLWVAQHWSFLVYTSWSDLQVCKWNMYDILSSLQTFESCLSSTFPCLLCLCPERLRAARSNALMNFWGLCIRIPINSTLLLL